MNKQRKKIKIVYFLYCSYFLVTEFIGAMISKEGKRPFLVRETKKKDLFSPNHLPQEISISITIHYPKACFMLYCHL